MIAYRLRPSHATQEIRDMHANATRKPANALAGTV